MASNVPLILTLMLCLLCNHGIESASNNSTNSTTKKVKAEKVLFDDLFASYDKRVRPVDDPTETVQLVLGIKLTKIVKMDSKEQQLTTNVMITQIWRDPYLKWNKVMSGGVDKIFVGANEIWTPDIALINNADESMSVAGHVKKFETRITVENKGVCRWSSPATFKSACDIKIRYWPFDVQKCLMTFGSFTMDASMLNITVLSQNSKLADRFRTSGDWDVKAVTTKQLYSNRFSTVTFEVELKRKPLYHMLYVIAPCAILCLLTLLSFAIPSESGERIGFITTILLAMTVYLLLVQQTLPETSEELPLVGLFFIVAIAETAFVLFATILVLRCFHKEGEPPLWLQRLFSCRCCCKKKTKKGTSPRPLSSLKRGETYANGGMLEMLAHDKIATDIVSVFSQMQTEEAEDGLSWQDISVKLNGVFFFISIIIIVVTYTVIYLNAASVTDTN